MKMFANNFFMQLFTLIAIFMLCLATPSTNKTMHSMNQGKESCHRFCTKEYNPLCAFDGNRFKLYANECIMKVDSCHLGKELIPTKMLSCWSELDPNIRRTCARVCGIATSPLCAKLGEDIYEIFYGYCVFHIEQCLTGEKWTKVAKRECEKLAYS